ncbi:MAG: polysaccharide deacetylase family protein [Planctomycetota bacterium]|jgi:peptidoglycan/xylan/chitin deacetylase (PgdA/CDA1 family)|nr:hypothetical protein [Planctomycetota bacterium]MDP6956184.1 polysaccharide deacetylase family protein [Planctomycetota bacterium]
MAPAPLKHRLKLAVREVWARLLWHTPLWRLADRLAPPRLVILAGHAIGGGAEASSPAGLAAEMVISRAALGQLVNELKRRHTFHTVSGGLAVLEGTASPARRGGVALSFDDGYRDNAELLPELVASWGVPATVYLESAPLEAPGERRVNWYHRLTWLEERLGSGEVARCLAGSGDAPAVAAHFADGHGAAPGELKRVLKYDEEPANVESAIEQLFQGEGGDGQALARELYMDWDGARALSAAGVELGGHTVTHPVMSQLTPEDCAREASECRGRIQAEVPGDEVRSFAYPFGRCWDWTAQAAQAVARAGFANAVTTHAGANLAGSESLALKRWALSSETQLHLIAAEACGGFELLRKLGLDLSE